MYKVPSRFLVRPSYLEGESLSSWRQRTAWENGYRLFPVADGHVRRSDPDLGYAAQDLVWVAALHDSTEQRCLDMTLSGQVGVLVSHVGSRSQPRWWLRCRYGKTGSHHGSMFCPQCLAADSIPYFRLSWRYAFSTVCPIHHSLLTDQCPQCGRPPWPSACGVSERISPSFTSFALCPYCDFNLSCTETRDLASPNLADGISSNHEALAHLFEASPLESLTAIRSICQLFIRTSSRRAILSSGSKWASIAQSVTDQGLRFNSVDHAPVGDRHLLITAALEICREWPESFLSFATDAGISRVHFNGSARIQPSWMNDIIDQSLARQNRFVSAEILSSTFASLTVLLGRRPCKSEIRRALNWQGDKGLEKLYRDLHDE